MESPGKPLLGPRQTGAVGLARGTSTEHGLLHVACHVHHGGLQSPQRLKLAGIVGVYCW